MVFRSPSVPPLHLNNETSITKYFFDHCPCPIIGVTATKGKGTTCTFIKALLDAEHIDTYLVGNIGSPAIDILDALTEKSVVIYELSSFQLWDLEKSPHIAILGHLEPDHLNIHKDYADYLNAKANITKYDQSQAKKIPYPFSIPDDIKNAITIPGEHNQNNCIAAIAAVACLKNISPDEYLIANKSQILEGLKNFKGLPHRLEYLRTLNNVKYYDDNFSTNPASTRVAVDSFPNENVILIIGGRDKTDYKDLPEIYEILQSKNLKTIVLIGESGHELAKNYQDNRFILAKSLEEAINTARAKAEAFGNAIVLMSPAAASFDMFENVYDRGAKFQNLINGLS